MTKKNQIRPEIPARCCEKASDKGCCGMCSMLICLDHSYSSPIGGRFFVCVECEHHINIISKREEV